MLTALQRVLCFLCVLLEEVGHKKWRRLWLRGGYPRSLIACSEALSLEWRDSFLRLYLERAKAWMLPASTVTNEASGSP